MTAFDGLRTRVRAKMHGRLANSRTLSHQQAKLLLLRSRRPGRSVPERLSDLLTACRRAESPSLRAALRRELEPYLTGSSTNVWREHQIGWGRYYESFGDIGNKRALTTSLVLKAPGPDGEKGVLYSSFEYNWMKLIANHDARSLLSEYYLVGATSWSPPDYAPFASFAGLSEDPVFMGVSNPIDMETYRLMEPVVTPVPLMACDWINPAHYSPKPHSERTIDILMVANWLSFKRHWLLFEALRDMRQDLRVVLIGRSGAGRTEREILDEARAFGVRQELELVSNVDIGRVTEYQCDARVSVLCSRREGSCVAPAECLFADTPIALMDDAHVGVKAYVNEETGVLLSRSTMVSQLEDLLQRAHLLKPRRWAMNNITCHHSSAKLNDQLRAHAHATGRPWTRDIATLSWRYVPSYVNEDQARELAPAVDDLRRRFGIELVKYE